MSSAEVSNNRRYCAHKHSCSNWGFCKKCWAQLHLEVCRFPLAWPSSSPSSLFKPPKLVGHTTENFITRTFRINMEINVLKFILHRSSKLNVCPSCRSYTLRNINSRSECACVFVPKPEMLHSWQPSFSYLYSYTFWGCGGPAGWFQTSFNTDPRPFPKRKLLTVEWQSGSRHSLA